MDRAAAPARLVEQGWRAYLVKVRNEAGVTGALTLESPQARPVYRRGTGLAMAPQSVRPADVTDRWLDLDTYGQKPMEPQLSGLELEYRIALLYSRDRGRREAQIGATLGPGTEDIGFRNRTAVLFDVAPSREVTLRVRDENGRPSMASFIVKDKLGRVYPARSKRLAPDFFFQEQIYRADGETIRLPAGEFTITCGRGPEYIPETRTVSINQSAGTALDFRLRRWIDPPAHGWYSGDHHIHAAGCSHYESPTEGVRPEDMMRHVLGEALSVGAVLNWGPSYYHQRQFFESKDNKLSTSSTLLRYDLEVSGFPSSHCGHLVLLRLREQDYPDTRQIEDWPTWDLPILKWAKAQGAVVGFAHSGHGLQVQTRDLPNYEMPPFNSIGANEYIVDVTHDVVDFISAADTPFVYELNIWYHTLNCGFRTRISGETDFPCITDARVGGGRSYVHLPQTLTYDAWCEGVRVGRSYVSDGFSHLMNFTANGLEAGTNGGELRLERPGTVKATVQAASLAARNGVRPAGAQSSAVSMESGVRARCRITRRHRRGHRERPSRGQPAAHGRRRAARSGVRHSDSTKQLDCSSHPRLRPHEPDLRPGRRPADSRVKKKRRVVPEGCRPVLVAEIATHQRGRASRRRARLRSRPRAVQADPVGERRRLNCRATANP